jgi:Glycosyl hydrolase family 30 beta sandwich domain
VPFVAFRNPQYNAITVIFLNSSQQPAQETLEMRGWNLERLMAYRTSEQEDCYAVPLPAESGPKITLTLEPRSITTLVAQIRRIRSS